MFRILTLTAACLFSGAALAADAEEKPLLLIHFDRAHVNYGPALAQGIHAAENAAPGLVYDVVSFPPAPSASPRQNARMSEQAEINLRTVVQALHEHGVDSKRIRVTTKERPGGPGYDSVAIFVR